MKTGLRSKIWLVLTSAIFFGAGSFARAQTEPGAIVEQVSKDLEAARAGIQEGDIILHWARADRKGEIGSPFDLSWIEIEEAPRGDVTLEGLSGTEKKTWILATSKWGIKTRPQMSDSQLLSYRQGQELVKADKLAEAAEDWKQVADQAKGTTRIWVLYRTGSMWADARRWDESDKAYQQAVDAAGDTGSVIRVQLFLAWAETYRNRSGWKDAEAYYQRSLAEVRNLGAETLTIALCLNHIGGISYLRGDLDKAEQYWKQTLDIRQKLAPGSLAVAASLDNLGLIAQERGDLAKAEEYSQQGLNIRQRLAPGSLDVATSLHNLGTLSFDRGDLAKAEEYYRQALDIRQRLAPGSLSLAITINNLGLVASHRGDLTKAEEYYRQALDIRQKLAPGSLNVSQSFTNLAGLAFDRGDLAKADEYYRQSLDIEQKLAPGGLDVAGSFVGLGLVAWNRGDLAKAEEYQQQALAIQRKLAPGSLDLAETLGNLGLVVRDQGNLDKAEEYFRESLEIKKKLAPGSVAVAAALTDLGEAALDRGDLAKAAEYDSQALEIQKKWAPESVEVATMLFDLGDIAQRKGDLAKAEQYFSQAFMMAEKLSPQGRVTAASLQGLGNLARNRHDLVKAEQYYRRALAIREKLGSGSADDAESLAALAAVVRDEQQPDAAAHLFEQALEALESQTARLGSTQDVRSEFRAKHSDYYKNYIDLLMAQKQPATAFRTAERLRARSLMEMLAVARVDIHQGADPELLERERAVLQALNAKRDRRVVQLTTGHTEQAKTLESEIDALRAEFQQVESRLRAASPAYAALTQPQPLDVRQIQALLDNDTLLLEYALGESRSYVWIISSTSLASYELPARASIDRLSGRLYKLLSPKKTGLSNAEVQPKRQVQRRMTAAALSRMILEPFAAQLQGKRLIIVADGLLQYIPFAVLPDPGKPHSIPLILDHELVYSPSASLVAELRREDMGRAQAAKAVAVLADPVFDKSDPRVVRTGQNRDPQRTTANQTGSSPNDRLTRSVTDVGLSNLPRLAFSRREAEAIMAVTPAGQGKKALGFEANRATATSPELGQYRIVHFATHALSDNIHPELSGLVLSLVNQRGESQNGFLDLQDIYNLNLRADMIVLSACETALGKEIRGEGLIGLTRGFMYAGATRVLASLWKVDDVATAELMSRFYKAMEQQGLQPAAALRQAQIQMSRQERWAAPYYWAGFQLQGEWK